MSEIGFRWWNITDKGQLESLGMTGYFWRPGINTATHLGYSGLCHRTGTAPAPRCRCGFYVWQDPHKALAMPFRRPTYNYCAFGAVEWWGRWYEHEEERAPVTLLRVQFAVVRAVVVTGKRWLADSWKPLKMETILPLITRWSQPPTDDSGMVAMDVG